MNSESAQQKRPTQRAADAGDSAARFAVEHFAKRGFGFSCSHAESTPAHTQVTQAVRQLPDNLLK